MLYYDKIDISEGRNVNKTSGSININVADYRRIIKETSKSDASKLQQNANLTEERGVL